MCRCAEAGLAGAGRRAQRLLAARGRLLQRRAAEQRGQVSAETRAIRFAQSAAIAEISSSNSCGPIVRYPRLSTLRSTTLRRRWLQKTRWMLGVHAHEVAGRHSSKSAAQHSCACADLTLLLRRDRLFELINELPTCYEIVSGKAPSNAGSKNPRKRSAPPPVRPTAAGRQPKPVRGRQAIDWPCMKRCSLSAVEHCDLS